MPRSFHPLSLRVLESAFSRGNAEQTAALLLQHARAGVTSPMRAYAGHPLEDDWTDFAHRALAAHFEAEQGHLYVVANSMQPEFHKVGMTSRAPEARLAELNNEAVVGELFLVQSWWVYDRYHLERLAHRALAAYPRFKEFFKAPWQEVLPRVQAALDHDRATLEKAGISPPSACVTATYTSQDH